MILLLDRDGDLWPDAVPGDEGDGAGAGGGGVPHARELRREPGGGGQEAVPHDRDEKEGGCGQSDGMVGMVENRSLRYTFLCAALFLSQPVAVRLKPIRGASNKARRITFSFESASNRRDCSCA